MACTDPALSKVVGKGAYNTGSRPQISQFEKVTTADLLDRVFTLSFRIFTLAFNNSNHALVERLSAVYGDAVVVEVAAEKKFLEVTADIPLIDLHWETEDRLYVLGELIESDDYANPVSVRGKQDGEIVTWDDFHQEKHTVRFNYNGDDFAPIDRLTDRYPSHITDGRWGSRNITLYDVPLSSLNFMDYSRKGSLAIAGEFIHDDHRGTWDEDTIPDKDQDAIQLYRRKACVD